MQGRAIQRPDWATIGRVAEENCASALAEINGLPSDVSLNGFIHAATRLGPLDHYKYFGGEASAIVRRVSQTCGAQSARAFLRAALGRTIGMYASRGKYHVLPSLCAYFHASHLERIARDPDICAEWLDLRSDLFQKEFGIASLRLYVAGSQLVDYRCSVPRSVVISEGVAKAFSKAFVMIRMGGFKPFFQIHTHAFNLGSFNEEGWNDCYRCCAELYELHPGCLGMFGSSWFYDPALEQISPRLGYLRKIPLGGGAHLLYVCDGGDAVSDATEKSRTRKMLYEEGKYLPKVYMLIWSRKQQTAWAARHPACAT